MQRLEIAGHLATDTIDPSGHMIDETGRYYPAVSSDLIIAVPTNAARAAPANTSATTLAADRAFLIRCKDSPRGCLAIKLCTLSVILGRRVRSEKNGPLGEIMCSVNWRSSFN